LAELDLISRENPGRLVEPPPGRAASGWLWCVEADHPDGGPWLYARDGVDTIVVTRVRPDGRYEHAVLDANGVPIEWRTVYRPELN
jgi:hypothetical protein